MNRKKLKLNMRFNNGKVICAKSPEFCKDCKDKKNCEIINTYHYPYEGIKDCFNNDERKT